MNGVFVHLYLPSEFLQLENITLTVIGQYNKSKPQLVKPYFFYYFLFFIYIFFLCVCFFCLFLFCCCLFLIFILFFLFCFVLICFCCCFFCCCCFVLFNGHFLVHCNCFLQFNLLVVLFPKPSVWVLIIWRTKLGWDIILK